MPRTDLLCLTALTCLGLFAFAACNTNDVIGSIGGGGADLSGASVSPDGSMSLPGSGPDAGGPNGQDGFCAGSGPPVLTSQSGGSVCAGTLAQVAFRYGICSCQDIDLGAPLVTDSYDSQMAVTPKNLGGSVGTNGGIASSAPISISGSLWASGSTGVEADSLSVGADLHDAGILGGQKLDTIGGNAFLAGGVNFGGPLTVTGILTIPAGQPATATPLNARVLRAPVSVPNPCDCSAANQIDIAGYINTYKQQNDNVSLFLDPTRLENYNGDTTLDWPCGHYYLTHVNGSGSLTWNINGRVALFIGGDLTLQSPFTINMAAGAELDLFIGGVIDSGASLSLGSPQSASKLRIYVGGSSLALQGAIALSGNLYAPNAQLAAGAAIEVYGALFVRQMSVQGAVAVHHDISILRAGQDCSSSSGTSDGGQSIDAGSSGSACQSCRDCGNQACVQNGQPGHCGACTDDSQCCSPLSCQKGQCVYLLG